MTRFGPHSFINIFLLSVALLALFPFGTNTAGFALLLWVFLLGSRIMWLLDSLFTRRPKTISNNMLPFILLAGMERRRTRDLIEKAHAIFSPLLYYWALAAIFYGCVYMFIYFSQGPVLGESISQFLTQEGHSLNQFNRLYMQTTLIDIAHMGALMIAVILAQFYAYTHKELQLLWAVPLALFLVQMLAYAFLYGYDQLNIPSGLSVLLYVLGFIMVWPLIENFKKEKPRNRYAWLGLLILFLFILCDVLIDLPARAPALWLCGWVSLSILWVRALGDKTKTYLFY